MVFDSLLLGKLTLTLCLTVLGLVCLSLLKDRDSRFSSFVVKVCSLFLVVRIGTFFLVFVIGQSQVQSDVVYYYDWAVLVNKGYIPGVSQNVPLRYGPLFLYVLAFLTRIWNDPKIIILFSILTELILFIVWLSLRKVVCDDLTMKRASVMYACCPLSILTSAVGGNNDVLAGMFVSIIVVLSFWNKPALSGLATGFSVVTSKALTALAGLPVFLASGHKALWLLGAILPIVIVYLWTFFLSADALAGLQFAGTTYSSGNLPFLVSLLGLDVVTGLGRWIANCIGALLVLLVTSLPLLAYKSFSRTDIVPIVAAATVMFMLVSAKSFPHYMLIALFPIMIIIAEMEGKSRMVVYCVFSVLTSVESSLWFRIFNNESPMTIYERSPSNQITFVLFGIIETSLLAMYGVILWRCIRQYVNTALVRWQNVEALH